MNPKWLGAPAKAIQELAGHQDLSTTQRYMHLTKAAASAAMRLLAEHASAIGNMVATADQRNTKSAE
jgi:hypothetical protein